MGEKHKWTVTVNGEQHTVMLRHYPGGELWVDSKLIKTWEPKEASSSIKFSLVEKDAILREFPTGSTDSISSLLDGILGTRKHPGIKLYVAGEEIPEETPPATV